jgi:hypothetical protein
VNAQDNAQIQALKQQVELLEQRLENLADTVEHNSSSQAEQKVHFGGYGEMHYRHVDNNGEDLRELDFHRFVLFVGYEFNENMRFVSELEVEHIIAGGSNRGAVELEQAYVEFDIAHNMQVQAGAILMPVGIINETHEPPRFYGVERPVIETTIIPSTWWSNAVNFSHKLDNGLQYDIMVSEGLKTEDPTTNANAEPFNIKKGKQKGSFADAFDLAITGRIRYTGVPGLELSAYAQYQPDLDQSAQESYAESATLLGGHVIYSLGPVTATALYARWDLEGEQAADAGQDVQDGGYVELAFKPGDKWGIFVRQSQWSLQSELDAQQTDFGINYWPHPDVVIKADYQLQNQDAGISDGYFTNDATDDGETNGFNLGIGYQF